jgi:RNA polymerase sigma factor (sigma-70 family)
MSTSRKLKRLTASTAATVGHDGGFCHGTAGDVQSGPKTGGARPRGPAPPVRDDSPVTDLVTRARTGDQQAWEALVDRYAPLVWSICAGYRLAATGAADAGQSVWLHLVKHLDHLRDPAALPGWLATTTRHECARVARAAHGPHAAVAVLDAENIAMTAEQELLTFERHAALRAAITQLPPRSQQLLALLTRDPPMPYAQISSTLGIPIGSIGPLRGRCLHQLRAHPAIAALINADAAPSV